MVGAEPGHDVVDVACFDVLGAQLGQLFVGNPGHGPGQSCQGQRLEDVDHTHPTLAVDAGHPAGPIGLDLDQSLASSDEEPSRHRFRAQSGSMCRSLHYTTDCT